MSDLDTDTQQKTADDAGQKPAGDVQDKPTPEQAELTFTPVQQAHLDRVIEERLSRQRAQFKKAEEDAKAKAEAVRLAEQGEFKALSDQRALRILELEAELKNREAETLRATAAAKHHIPADLISRLVGETVEEIEADAARLAKHLAPPKAPNTEAGEKPAVSRQQTLEQRAAELRASGDYAAF